MTIFLKTLVGVTLMAVMSLSSEARNISAQYNVCVSEIKAVYGGDTRVSLKKSKTRKGVTTLKLKVVPPETGVKTLLCTNSVETGDEVVLLGKDGKPIAT